MKHDGKNTFWDTVSLVLLILVFFFMDNFDKILEVFK